jgi:predicted nucleic acid-binding Zn ribbon protein
MDKDGTTRAGEPQAGAAERTYQMLWDCPHCMTKKNLGLSHRHCPSCGAPQDASWRYFPSDDEKVAVEDHPYAGADLKCGYCGAWSGRRCQHCANCGAPLRDASDARTRGEQVTQGRYAGETQQDAQREFQPANAPRQPARKRRLWPWLVGAVVLVVVGVLVFGKRDADLRVTGHSWKREIAIERFGPVEESDWCDRMPQGATGVHRSRAVRSKRQVEDGHECRTRRQDRGDGTYTETQECTPRYKEEPVYADRCSYRVAQWSRVRDERRMGHSLEEQPRWPDVRLVRSGECTGCEREGDRTEQYVVEFEQTDDGKKVTCEVDQSRWASLSVGSKWRGRLSRVGSSVDCGGLERL